MRSSKVLTSVLLLIAISGLIGTVYFYNQSQTLKDEKAAIQEQVEKISERVKEANKAKETDAKPRQAVGKKDDTDAINDEASSSEANIIIESHTENDTIVSPVTVSGKARTFENTVNVRIKDASGKELAESFTTATGEMGQHSDFSAVIEFDKGTAKTGAIEAFQYSAKDGTEIDKVTVPVTFN